MTWIFRKKEMADRYALPVVNTLYATHSQKVSKRIVL